MKDLLRHGLSISLPIHAIKRDGWVLPIHQVFLRKAREGTAQDFSRSKNVWSET